MTQQRSNLPWILTGCGVLLLFSCCLTSAGAGGIFYFRQSRSPSAGEMEARLTAESERQLIEEERTRAGAGPVVPEFVGTPSVTVQARVTQAVGRRLTVRVGDPCAFTIEYPERSNAPGQRWCHTAVRCGAVTLYGGGTGGYFPCTFSQSPPAVRGTDTETTSEDRDPAFTIDTAAGTLRVRDDSTGDYGVFQVDAAITLTR